MKEQNQNHPPTSNVVSLKERIAERQHRERVSTFERLLSLAKKLP